MATTMKRFTISLTPELEQNLDEIKKELFHNKTQTEMVRQVLFKGLEFLKVIEATQQAS